ncbi:MAG: CsbD family protein [Algoriphagus sp.]|uniref:CsbD family protein n=1 Tax=Algoriphagus sp. TaxID=1872435 RepID=UPI002731DA52|nr:CsbD family protein [Algoriphagus sp.]MDP2043476.1 CsbD family protein [Algoriphagus sp.]MDP3472238.1 CsbD family protein [Algoriphagus sp.]
MSLQLKGTWNQIKGELKEKFGELTDDDLLYQEGQEDKILGKLQEKTGENIQSLRKMMFKEEQL